MSENHLADGEPLDSGVLAVTLLLRMCGREATPAAVRLSAGESKQPFSYQDIGYVLTHFSISHQRKRFSIKKARNSNMPLLCRAQDGRFFLILSFKEGKFLIRFPEKSQTQVVSEKDLEDIWDKFCIVNTDSPELKIRNDNFDFFFVFGLFSNFKIYLLHITFSSFCINLLSLMTPLFLLVVIDKVLSSGSEETLNVLVFGLIVVVVFEIILSFIKEKVFSFISNKIDIAISSMIVEKIVSLPFSFFANQKTGSIASSVNEVKKIRNFVTGGSITTVIDAAFTFIFLLVMFQINPEISIYIACGIAALVVVCVAISPWMRRYANKSAEAENERDSYLAETLSGIGTVKAFAMEPAIRRSWAAQAVQSAMLHVESGTANNWSQQISSAISKALIVLTLWLGARAVIAGDMTPGEFIAFNMLVGRVSTPALRVAQFWPDLQSTRVAMTRLNTILQQPSERRFGTRGRGGMAIKGAIGLTDVTVSYEAEAPQGLSSPRFSW